MAANSFNRETARDYLATLLTTAMVGAPAIAQAVYNYNVKTLNGQSPVVIVDSGSITRVRVQQAQQWNTSFLLEVTAFVLWANPSATPAWTEAMCADRHDLIEKTLADVVLDNSLKTQSNSAPWTKLSFAGPSVPDARIEEGRVYWAETYPLRVEVMDE